MDQRSAEWFAARAGHLTASRLADALSRLRDGTAGATSRNEMVRLVTERLTGAPVNGYANEAMAWGTAHEEAARQAYEAVTGFLAEEAGFILHPSVAWLGASPDGLVGADGLVEIKCPYVSTVHVETILRDAVPPEHKAQIQCLLWCTGRSWCDFVSYDPRMPPHLQMFIHRMERDEAYLAEIEPRVREFLDGVTRLTEKLLTVH